MTNFGCIYNTYVNTLVGIIKGEFVKFSSFNLLNFTLKL